MSLRRYRSKTPVAVDLTVLPDGVLYGFGSQLTTAERGETGQSLVSTLADGQIVLETPQSPKPPRFCKKNGGDNGSFTAQVASSVTQALQNDANWELVAQGQARIGGANDFYVQVKVGTKTYNYAFPIDTRRQGFLVNDYDGLGIKDATGEYDIVFASDSLKPPRAKADKTFAVPGDDGNPADSINTISVFCATDKLTDLPDGWEPAGGTGVFKFL